MSLNSMRAGRSTPQVILVKYINIRGKNPNGLIFVFEGLDDLPYYETIFNRVTGRSDFVPVIAKGKGQLLGFREIVRGDGQKDENIRFFVDRDFDGLRGWSHDKDIYITDGYSIENSLIGKDILEALVMSEYKCCVDADYSDLRAVESLYDKLLDEFISVMRPINRAIYHARMKEIALQEVEDRISEYVSIGMEGVFPSGKDYFSLIGWPDDAVKDIPIVDDGFDGLDPLMHWRGKFIYAFFLKFLHLIKCDRTSDSPKLFQKKVGMRFDPNGEVIRSFSSISIVPGSLSEFFKICPGGGEEAY